MTMDRSRDPDVAAEAQYRLIERLAESERRHREILTYLPEVVVRLEADGVISFLNAAWSRILGHEVDDSIGTRIDRC